MMITVSPAAAERLSAILIEQAGEHEGLRILARGGGCACSGGGFAMGIDAATTEDTVLDFSGVRVIVDPLSAQQLEGAAIDYVDELMRKGFTIDAPNAIQGHGDACGSGGGCGGGACACGGH
jgi:iron-sulfur cluster assembly protein